MFFYVHKFGIHVREDVKVINGNSFSIGEHIISYGFWDKELQVFCAKQRVTVDDSMPVLTQVLSGGVRREGVLRGEGV